MAEASTDSAGKTGGFLKWALKQINPFGDLFKNFGLVCIAATFNIFAAPASAAASAIATSTSSIGGILKTLIWNAWSGVEVAASKLVVWGKNFNFGTFVDGFKTIGGAFTGAPATSAATGVAGTVPLSVAPAVQACAPATSVASTCGIFTGAVNNGVQACGIPLCPSSVCIPACAP